MVLVRAIAPVGPLIDPPRVKYPLQLKSKQTMEETSLEQTHRNISINKEFKKIMTTFYCGFDEFSVISRVGC